MADILIAEDVPLQQTIIQQFLQPAHSIVGCTTEEDEAVELTAKHDPDMVIMDLDLVDGDGMTAARRIKDRSPDTKIIVSTALVAEDVKERTREIPVEAYLMKPYSENDLLEAIESALPSE